jgi:hypothetical protein
MRYPSDVGPYCGGRAREVPPDLFCRTETTSNANALPPVASVADDGVALGAAPACPDAIGAATTQNAIATAASAVLRLGLRAKGSIMVITILLPMSILGRWRWIVGPSLI